MDAAAPGSRSTRQRTAVQHLLADSDRFRSARTIHDELRRDGHGIGLTTVYRILQSLVDGRVVDVVRAPTGEIVYRRCAASGHHHHLVCRSCGSAVEIAASRVEAWVRETADRHGFGELTHTVEIFGLCRLCSAP